MTSNNLDLLDTSQINCIIVAIAIDDFHHCHGLFQFHFQFQFPYISPHSSMHTALLKLPNLSPVSVSMNSASSKQSKWPEYPIPISLHFSLYALRSLLFPFLLSIHCHCHCHLIPILSLLVALWVNVMHIIWV